MLIATGAEAEIALAGGAIEKTRRMKKYRNKILDESLRKKRTRLEAKLISEARRSGVPAPAVLSQGRFSIKMEYIEGKKVRDVMNGRNCAGICRKIAGSVAKMHNSGIIHGDLTTSNMMLKGGDICFIDFGLGCRSQRTEDKATDLYLLKEALESTHPGLMGTAWDAFLKAYREKTRDERTLNALKKIQKRRRYSKGD
ncbi:MAG: Kae1-associated serine/threonine protein kinase [Candidatus Aenigmarchaeota archaeon]|nr:Kae1-associated serine/threonine protein kinase [Candidatus Aenigmarchaeota archaeon]